MAVRVVCKFADSGGERFQPEHVAVQLGEPFLSVEDREEHASGNADDESKTDTYPKNPPF